MKSRQMLVRSFRWLVPSALLALVACAPSAQPAATSAPPPPTAKAAPAAVEPTMAPATPAAKSTAAAPAVTSTAATKSADSSLDALYELAKAEGGTLSCYCAISVGAAEHIFTAFSTRFPELQVEHVDATADKLAARAISEARGGKVLGDVFAAEVEVVAQMNDQQLLLHSAPPEAAEYPDTLHGPFWVASDIIYITASWNTNLVKPEDAPTSFEDFADPKWKDRLIAEPRDEELLTGLARHKYNTDEEAIGLMKRIAANNPQFHQGHSALTEMVAGGQAVACFTCYAHHYPDQMQNGAPVDFMRTEAVGFLRAMGVFKDAPHPNSAMLFWRWSASEEGQRAAAAGGLAPAHPSVEPEEPVRPERVYPLGVEDVAQIPKYDSLWKEIFQLR